MIEPKITATTISIDPDSIKQIVDQAVENSILTAVSTLGTDTEWLEKIERMINQAVVQRTVASLGSVDVNTVIRKRVDEIMDRMKSENFSSIGIEDRATNCQLTIMDETTVVENKLISRSAEIVADLTVKDLVVKGSVNTDNRSWEGLVNLIADKTLKKVGEDWRDQLVSQVRDTITQQGINVNDAMLSGRKILVDGQLGPTIIESNLQKIGRLKSLTVDGEASLNGSLTVLKNRVGINTELPESALSIWDEEVSVVIGKHRQQEAFVGTSRNQSLSIGINKTPYIKIDVDGSTTISKLRVDRHLIGHCNEVPGWSGTRGDIMFNSNPVPNSPFAWVCLGAFKWKPLKVTEE